MTPKGGQMRVEVEKGKYTFFQKGHTIHVLRYGEKWCVIEKAAKAIIALMGELEEARKELDKAHEVVESWSDCGYCNLPTCWQRSNSATCGGHTRAEWRRYKGWLDCPEAADAIETGEHRKENE